MCDTKKEQIAEHFAEIFIGYGYSPITARMLALLYTSNQKYFTFYELMDLLNISKSATSKALKLLLQIGEVSYITKGDNKRKRYFYIYITGSIRQLKDFIDLFSLHMQLYKDLLALRNDDNKELNTFIEQQISYMQDIVPQMKDKCKKYFKT